MRDVAVLHRIEVDVVQVGGEIPVVADGVLPIATLPYPWLALRRAAVGQSDCPDAPIPVINNNNLHQKAV